MLFHMFRRPGPKQSTARAVAAPNVVRSWAGTQTRLHSKENHGPWLHIALFLADLPKRDGS